MHKKNAILLLWLSCGLLGLFTFVRYFDATRMEASVDINVNRKQAAVIASDFIRSEGFDLSNYKQAVIFYGCDAIYLQKFLGVKRTNEIIRTEVPCWIWSVRYYQELKKEGFYVSIDPSSGEVNYYYHSLLDNSEGKNIAQEKAQKIAEQYFSTFGEVLEDYKLMKESSTKLENRTDHKFTWTKKGFSIGEAELQIAMGINGDQLGFYNKYLRIPEQFSRDFVKEEIPGFILTAVSYFGLLLLGLLAIFSLIVQHKQYRVKWRFAFMAGLLVFPLACLNFFNSLPLTWYSYVDTLSKHTFLLMAIAGAVISVIFTALIIFLFCAAGESLAARLKNDAFPVIHGILNKSITREKLFSRIIIGYSLGFCGLGYVTVFYLICMNHFDVWVPISPQYSNILTTSMPFLFPLTVAVTAALTEEFITRMFAISILRRYIKVIWLSVFIPAVIWAFAHSSYQIYPMYVRGIELTIVGIIWGVIYLIYGIETTIMAHFAYNAVMVGIPLMRSNNDYFVFSGIMVIILLALPGIFSPLWLRRKTASTGEVRTEAADQAKKAPWPATALIPAFFILFFCLPYFIPGPALNTDEDVIKPFKTYYDSGAVMSEGVYKNGKRDGYHVKYYENGRKKWDADYNGGDIVGDIKYYYENGALKSTGGFTDGVWQGQWMFYNKNGVLTSAGQYIDGLRDGAWTWYKPGGEIQYVKRYQKGDLQEAANIASPFKVPEARKTFTSQKVLEQGEVIVVEVKNMQNTEQLHLYQCTSATKCDSARFIKSWTKADEAHNPLFRFTVPEKGKYYFWIQNVQKPKDDNAVYIKEFEYIDEQLQMEFSSGSIMRVYLDEMAQ